MVSLGGIARKIFGSSYDRRVKSYRPRTAEITALEPESRAAVGQGPAQPTDSATLAAWEQDWAARVKNHRRKTEG